MSEDIIQEEDAPTEEEIPIETEFAYDEVEEETTSLDWDADEFEEE